MQKNHEVFYQLSKECVISKVAGRCLIFPPYEYGVDFTKVVQLNGSAQRIIEHFGLNAFSQAHVQNFLSTIYPELPKNVSAHITEFLDGLFSLGILCEVYGNE